MPMRRGFAAYQLPAIVWAALIFVASSIPGTEYPQINIVGIDKVVHFAIYAILCLLTYNAVKHQDLFPRLARRAMSHPAEFDVTTTLGNWAEAEDGKYPK